MALLTFISIADDTYDKKCPSLCAWRCGNPACPCIYKEIIFIDKSQKLF